MSGALGLRSPGPKPAVESGRVEGARDGRATVTVVVANRGGGSGEAAVEVTLRDRASGAVVAREELEELVVELRTREPVALSRALVVSGTPDVVAEAKARYPP